MSNLRVRLPPVSSLVVFEAAARLLSFTAAAAELNVTQAAVSRQIRGLEDHLGVALFQRLYRAVRLTAEGESLFVAVRMGLDHIARATEAVRRSPGPAQVTVSTTIAFGTFWLMPRIGKFRAAHPEIDVRLIASDHYVDPGSGGVDLAVRYGNGPWPGLDSAPLFTEEIFPVCSPAYLDQHRALRRAQDLTEHTLLHLDSGHRSWIDWDTWMRHLGLNLPAIRRGPRFNTYTILVQAAAAGQGIALGWHRMIEELLRSGALVRPVPESIKAPEAYHLLIPWGVTLGGAAGLFREWILAEAHGTAAP